MTAQSPFENEEEVESPSERSPFMEAALKPEHAHPPLHSRHFQLYTLTLLMALIFVIEFGVHMIGAPMIRLFESILCHDYYKLVDPSLLGENGVVEEKYCKIEQVQGELATLDGWQMFFDYLPGLFLAVPFGMLADKIGRKWLMAMNMVSICLRFTWFWIVCAFPQALPIRLIWLQGVLGIFGGGTIVTTALAFTIMTDVTPKPQRANVFFIAQATHFATYLLAPPLGAVLMDRDPWIPMTLGVAMTYLTIPLALALPETLNALTPLLSTSPTPDNPTSSSSQFPTLHLPPRPLITRTKTLLTTSLSSTSRLLLQTPHLPLLLLLIEISTSGLAASKLFLQYLSNRYSLTLSHASLLVPFRAAVSILTLLALLPFLSHYLLKTRSPKPMSAPAGYSVREKDILLSRLSFSLLALGFTIQALSPTLPLFLTGIVIATLGAGSDSLIRSFLASLVSPDEVAHVFTIMSMVQTVGILASAPTIAGLYKVGLSWGGIWAGLPFLVTGGLFGVGTVFLARLRGSKEGEKAVVIGSEEAGEEAGFEEEGLWRRDGLREERDDLIELS